MLLLKLPKGTNKRSKAKKKEKKGKETSKDCAAVKSSCLEEPGARWIRVNAWETGEQGTGSGMF